MSMQLARKQKREDINDNTRDVDRMLSCIHVLAYRVPNLVVCVIKSWTRDE